MVEVELSLRLYSGRSNTSSRLRSSPFLPQLFGKCDPATGVLPALPKPPLGLFPHSQPGSLPAQRSSRYLGGGRGGGAGSCLALGIGIAPGVRVMGLPADRLFECRRAWLPLWSCTRIEGVVCVTRVKSIKS